MEVKVQERENREENGRGKKKRKKQWVIKNFISATKYKVQDRVLETTDISCKKILLN